MGTAFTRVSLRNDPWVVVRGIYLHPNWREGVNAPLLTVKQGRLSLTDSRDATSPVSISYVPLAPACLLFNRSPGV